MSLTFTSKQVAALEAASRREPIEWAEMTTREIVALAYLVRRGASLSPELTEAGCAVLEALQSDGEVFRIMEDHLSTNS